MYSGYYDVFVVVEVYFSGSHFQLCWCRYWFMDDIEFNG